MPDDATEGVAKHSFLGGNYQSTCMPHGQLFWYQMYYPGGMKARVSPDRSLIVYISLTQDSNPGGLIQNHKR